MEMRDTSFHIEAAGKHVYADLPPSGAMWSLETLLRILVEPAGFYRDRSGDCAFSHVASFCMIHAVVLTVVGIAAGLIGQSALAVAAATLAEALRVVSTIAIWATIAALLSLAASVIIAALMHPVVLLVGGRGGFKATYAAVVYAAAPAGLTCVLGLYLPEVMPDGGGSAISVWLNVAGALWSVALFAMGVTELHRMDALGGSIVTIAPLAAVATVAAWLVGPENDRRVLLKPDLIAIGIAMPHPLEGGLPNIRAIPLVKGEQKAQDRRVRPTASNRQPEASRQRARRVRASR